MINSVQDLFTFYLDLGCPCRFPRFRKMVAQPLPSGFASRDCAELLAHLEQRLEIRDKQEDPALGWVGHCARCNSHITFRDVPVYRDASVWHATIVVSCELDLLGADATGPVPYRHPIHAIVSGVRKSELSEIQSRYPFLPVADWFLYLSATRQPTPQDRRY